MGGTSAVQGGTTGPGCTSGRNAVEEPGRRHGLQPGRARPKGRAAHPRSEGKATRTPLRSSAASAVKLQDFGQRIVTRRDGTQIGGPGAPKGDLEPGHGRRGSGGQDGLIIVTFADQRPFLCEVDPAESGKWVQA